MAVSRLSVIRIMYAASVAHTPRPSMPRHRHARANCSPPPSSPGSSAQQRSPACAHPLRCGRVAPRPRRRTAVHGRSYLVHQGAWAARRPSPRGGAETRRGGRGYPDAKGVAAELRPRPTAGGRGVPSRPRRVREPVSPTASTHHDAVEHSRARGCNPPSSPRGAAPSAGWRWNLSPDQDSDWGDLLSAETSMGTPPAWRAASGCATHGRCRGSRPSLPNDAASEEQRLVHSISLSALCPPPLFMASVSRRGSRERGGRGTCLDSQVGATRKPQTVDGPLAA